MVPFRTLRGFIFTAFKNVNGKMKKPIFRVFVSYEIKNKKVVTRKAITGILDTFVLTSNIKEIENDQELIDRIC